MRPSPYTLLLVVAAAAGLYFAAFSTYDFVQHLDRQLNDIHCSFIPGIAATDASGASGCRVALMSPYSSVFRREVWGGIPISLPAMSVFAFLLFRGLDLWLNRREQDRGATRFLVAATLLPVLASAVMGYIAFAKLGAACKLCMGIYASSVVGFVAALLQWRQASARRLGEEVGLVGEPLPGEPDQGMRGHLMSFLEGVGFVAVPVLVYLVAMPDYSKYLGSCGTLAKPEDPYGVMVPMGQQGSGKETIEVFDPLCPACLGFETRLEASGLASQLKRRAVLFPLDPTCNWMVGSAVHPGACTVSEAVLCAGERSAAVIDWAFDHQEEIRAAADARPEAAAEMVGAAFPELKSCLGSPAVRSKLNKSLRWAVANQLPVLTPQIYIEGRKLCDEDTDLGMDYALSRMLKQAAPAASEAR